MPGFLIMPLLVEEPGEPNAVLRRCVTGCYEGTIETCGSGRLSRPGQSISEMTFTCRACLVVGCLVEPLCIEVRSVGETLQLQGQLSARCQRVWARMPLKQCVGLLFPSQGPQRDSSIHLPLPHQRSSGVRQDPCG